MHCCSCPWHLRLLARHCPSCAIKDLCTPQILLRRTPIHESVVYSVLVWSRFSCFFRCVFAFWGRGTIHFFPNPTFFRAATKWDDASQRLVWPMFAALAADWCSLWSGVGSCHGKSVGKPAILCLVVEAAHQERNFLSCTADVVANSK